MDSISGISKFISSEPMIIIWIVLITFSVWTIFPFFWTIITSIKIPGEKFTQGFLPYIQFEPTSQNWANILTGPERERTLLGLKSSVIISALSSLLVLVLGSFAGYALACFHFRRRKDIAVWILSNRMFPPIAVAIPFFLMMRSLRLLDTLPAVIIAHTVFNLPLAIWLMK